MRTRVIIEGESVIDFVKTIANSYFTDVPWDDIMDQVLCQTQSIFYHIQADTYEAHNKYDKDIIDAYYTFMEELNKVFPQIYGLPNYLAKSWEPTGIEFYCADGSVCVEFAKNHM